MHAYDENKIRGKLIIEKPVAQVFHFFFFSFGKTSKQNKKEKGKKK